MKTKESKTCETCEHLLFFEGAFGCAKGIEPSEDNQGQWDFDSECIRHELTPYSTDNKRQPAGTP